MKKLIIIGVLSVLTLTLASCGGDEKNNSTTAPTTAAQENDVNSDVKTLSEPIAEMPIILTSSGQSADVEMVKTLLEKKNMNYTFDMLLKEDSIPDDAKTLVVVVGGSSKGLGAAGIKPEEELDRVAKVIAKAKEKNLTIIAMHIGGEGRRGELSDKFINDTMPSSNYMIVVEDGNKDGLFTNIATQNSIPMNTATNIAGVIEPLEKAFK